MFIGTAAVTFSLLPYHAARYGFSSGMMLAFALLMLWNGLSITAGYHRLWAHKSYKAQFPVRLLFALGGALALQNSIKVWCADHRRHHQYVDNPEKDPYAATRGLWYSHIGWMLHDYSGASCQDRHNIKDLEQDRLVNWQSKYYFWLAFVLNVMLPLGIGYLFGDAVGGLLLLGFARLVLCHHMTFFINSLAHFWGKRPYSEASSARDNGIVALLTYGEGYHNFHHAFQWDYRNGLRWYQFDPTKWLIGSLSFFKLTSNLKRTPPEQIERCMVKLQLVKTRAAILSVRLADAEMWLERLEKEYNSLLDSINKWAACRREYRQKWLELKKLKLARHWEATELRKKLSEIEVQLKIQRDRWRRVRLQFA